MVTYEIRKLSAEFFNKYPNPPYNEIERKPDRPYDVVLFKTIFGYYICIPFRTNINHNNAFIFKNTKRSSNNNPGLDYSKILIIKNDCYIGEQTIIDNDEFKIFVRNKDKIHNQAFKYVQRYVNHFNDIRKINYKEFNRYYKYSTLQYFHSELGIDEVLQYNK